MGKMYYSWLFRLGDVKMCTVKVEAGKAPASVNVTCEKTGKDIITTNQWGQYCEDLCGIEEDKKEAKAIMDIVTKSIKEWDF